MPIVHVSPVQRRGAAAVSACARKVARIVQQALAASLEVIRVLVGELPATHLPVGDRTRAEIDAARRGAPAGDPS